MFQISNKPPKLCNSVWTWKALLQFNLCVDNDTNEDGDAAANDKHNIKFDAHRKTRDEWKIEKIENYLVSSPSSLK